MPVPCDGGVGVIERAFRVPGLGTVRCSLFVSSPPPAGFVAAIVAVLGLTISLSHWRLAVGLVVEEVDQVLTRAIRGWRNAQVSSQGRSNRAESVEKLWVMG